MDRCQVDNKSEKSINSQYDEKLQGEIQNLSQIIAEATLINNSLASERDNHSISSNNSGSTPTPIPASVGLGDIILEASQQKSGDQETVGTFSLAQLTNSVNSKIIDLSTKDLVIEQPDNTNAAFNGLRNK